MLSSVNFVLESEEQGGGMENDCSYRTLRTFDCFEDDKAIWRIYTPVVSYYLMADLKTETSIEAQSIFISFLHVKVDTCDIFTQW